MGLPCRIQGNAQRVCQGAVELCQWSRRLPRLRWSCSRKQSRRLIDQDLHTRTPHVVEGPMLTASHLRSLAAMTRPERAVILVRTSFLSAWNARDLTPPRASSACTGRLPRYITGILLRNLPVKCHFYAHSSSSEALTASRCPQIFTISK